MGWWVGSCLRKASELLGGRSALVEGEVASDIQKLKQDTKMPWWFSIGLFHRIFFFRSLFFAGINSRSSRLSDIVFFLLVNCKKMQKDQISLTLRFKPHKNLLTLSYKLCSFFSMLFFLSFPDPFFCNIIFQTRWNQNKRTPRRGCKEMAELRARDLRLADQLRHQSCLNAAVLKACSRNLQDKMAGHEKCGCRKQQVIQDLRVGSI